MNVNLSILMGLLLFLANTTGIADDGTLVGNGLDPRLGEYNVYVGYCLETSSIIIYNLHPITFEVVP
jgi:hypothetical protein